MPASSKPATAAPAMSCTGFDCVPVCCGSEAGYPDQGGMYMDTRDQLISRLFDLIDDNGNGFLTAGELSAVISNSDTLIEAIGPAKSDEISAGEFSTWTREYVVAKLPGMLECLPSSLSARF